MDGWVGGRVDGWTQCYVVNSLQIPSTESPWEVSTAILNFAQPSSLVKDSGSECLGWNSNNGLGHSLREETMDPATVM